ncbi:hypothetical protein IC582_013717 [Cucumis melo]
MSMIDLKLNGLKFHDYHVFLQQLYPIAKRSVLPKYVWYTITRLCIFFNVICNKVVDVQQLEKLEEDIVVAYEIGMGNVEISDNLRWIAHGPHHFVIKYNSYTINGCRFHTESYDKKNLEMEKMNVTTKVVKEEVNVDVIILNDQQEDAIEVHNENKIVCDSNIKMPLPLKTILRFVENVMDKDSGIRYQLPFSLFGIGRKTCVL